MKARLQLLVSAIIFSIFGPASSPAVTLPILNWATSPVNDQLSDASNWSQGASPTPGSELVFGHSTLPFVNLDTSLSVKSITFSSGGYESYFFGTHTGATLSLSHGITLPAHGSATVRFGPNVSIELLQSQTWAIDGSLTVYGDIGEPTATTSTLTKIGAGTLTLGGSNVFSGGLNVQQGTLRLASTSFEESESTVDGPVGSGHLSLASGTTLAADVDDLDLHNDITLGSAVTNNHVTFDTGEFGGLFLDGDLTAASDNTTIYLAGENTLEVAGTIDGPENTQLVFKSAGTNIGSAAFGATFTSNIQSITADNAALFFFIAPSSPLTLAAVNRGYIGAAVNVEDITPISPNALLSLIANPASYAGTFGVDTDPDMGTPHVFTEALNFTNFTHADFRFGSHTMSVVTGPISPVVNGTTSLYPFGGGSGHLVIASDLADAPGAPASVLVSSHAGTDPQYVILRGNNSFTGSYTLDGIAAQIAVQRAIAVLDSPTALPGASSTFTFGAGEHAYIGATEAAFPSFNSFLARLAPGGHNPLSILGLDSHDMFEVKIAHGEEAKNYSRRHVNEVIDLRSFSSIYLGSASDVQINGPIYAPTDGVLRLTGVDDGRLTVAAPLGDNVTSVEIGSSAPGGSEEFGDGTVEMRAPQTYSGGTTLRSGRLAIGHTTHLNHETQTIDASPIGTGALTVMPGIGQAILTAANAYSDFYNSIILNAPLQLGERFIPRDIPMITSETDTTLLNLYSDISGSGGLKIYSAVKLAGNNTYTGGTEINSSWVQVQSANAFGTGTITFRSDGSDANVLSSYQSLTLTNALSISGTLSFFTPYAETHLAGPISLESPAELQFTSGAKVKMTGAISGMHSLDIYGGLGGHVWIGDSVATPPVNTYSGGTNVRSGAVVFANPSAIPVTGKLYASYEGYIGAAFGSNPQSSFLERFDKSETNGTIGFDSADHGTPTVVSDPLDLTGFNPTARLGSSTVAIITGTITPSSGGYQFGGGGGELTIASNLDGDGFINVNSSTHSPLTLVLKGDNSAASGLSVVSSIVRLDGAAALPSGFLNAYSYGYIGYTENVSGLTPSTFLGKFGTAGPNAIIGFDSANPQSPRTISENISLGDYSTTFQSDTYIGTSTAINLTGALTAFGATTLNLTGVGQGRLMVNSAITSTNATHLVIGTPHESISGRASVTLNAANSYTGGTTLRNTHLVLGNATALGTGTLTNDGAHGQLSVNQSSGLTIANLIDTGTAGDELNLNGPNSFTLSGDISGTGDLSKTGSSVVTLSGNNSAFTGRISINEGSMAFTQDTSAGLGGLEFASIHGATAQFLSSAPTIGSLSGYNSNDQIILAPNATLTINQHHLADSVYQGTIAGAGASLVFQAQTDSIPNNGASPLAETTIPVRAPRITLHGANTYSGGTTIRNDVILVAANSAALGSGNVTIDGGTLAISPGTTLTFDTTSTRQLVFTNGRIAGYGTVALATNLTIGAQQMVSPGLDFTGKLSFDLNSSAILTFASGGTYQWKLADAGGAPTGWGFLQVAGTVDVTAGTSAGSTFDLELHTVGPNGSAGFAANFNPYAPMSWAVLTATNITNFDPAKFNIVTTDFLNPTNGGAFSLKLVQDSASSTLFLNFTPVPEPSTWALLLSGLAVVAFTALRRRK